jgi:hypothetical protein
MRVRAHVLDRVVECREGNNQRVIWCVLGSLREIRRLQPCADGARRPQRLELLRERRCECLLLLHQRILPLSLLDHGRVVCRLPCTFRG